MANKILVDLGEKGMIARELNCSLPTIRTALNGKETTAIHKKIRVLALERGGIEVAKVEHSAETQIIQ